MFTTRGKWLFLCVMFCLIASIRNFVRKSHRLILHLVTSLRPLVPLDRVGSLSDLLDLGPQGWGECKIVC